MTTLPTCPHEDCTESDRHYHLLGGTACQCSKDLDYCQRNHADDDMPATFSPYYAPRTPQPQPAPVVLPTVEDVVDIIKAGGFYSDTAQAVLDLIAACLPVWQPVQPGTVIKAGTHYRIEYGDGRANEHVASFDRKVDNSAPLLIDPRTVPAEPEDPRVAVVAKAMSDALDDNGVTTCDWTAEARDILAKLDGLDR